MSSSTIPLTPVAPQSPSIADQPQQRQPPSPPIGSYKDNEGHAINPNTHYENRRARLSDGDANRSAEANSFTRNNSVRYVGADMSRFEKRMARLEEAVGDNEGVEEEAGKGTGGIGGEGEEGRRFYGADSGKFNGRLKRVVDDVEGKERGDGRVVFSGGDVLKFQKRCMKVLDK